MNREDAQKLIGESVGIFVSDGARWRRSRPFAKDGEYSLPRFNEAFKRRPDFDCNINMPNEYALPPLANKPPVKPLPRPDVMRFCAQEKKIIARAEYVYFAAEGDVKSFIQMRSPEKFIKAVCRVYKGGNLSGKLCSALNKRVLRLKTYEQTQAEIAERGRQRLQRLQQEKEANRRLALGSLALLFAYLAAVTAVVAVIVGFGMRPIMIGEASGAAYAVMVAVPFVCCAAAAALNKAYPYVKLQGLFNLRNVIAIAAAVLFASTAFSAFKTSGFTGLWIAFLVVATVLLAAAPLLGRTAKRYDFKTKIKCALISFALMAFAAAVGIELKVNSFNTADYDGSLYEFYYRDIGGGELEVTPSFFNESLSVPSEINGKKVTRLAYHRATGYKSKLNIITLPSTVNEVDPKVFEGCKNLTMVTAHSSILNKIPLKKVTFIEVRGGELNNLSFVGAANLKTVNVTGDTRIGARAFNGRTALREVRLMGDLTSIGDGAFGGCRSLTEISIPNTVGSIGVAAFTGCTSLRRIGLPAGLGEISLGLFSGCASLEFVSIPDSVTAIQNAAFMGCESLQSLRLPDGLAYLGSDRTFEGCTSIQSVTASAQFAHCVPQDALTSVTITSGEIPEGAFMRSPLLQTAVVCDGVTAVGDSAFRSCYNLSSVYLGNSVTSIGRYAFAGCRSLTSVTLPVALTELSGWMFEWCTSLKKVVLPSSLTAIRAAAFWGCGQLTDITLPSGVTSLGEGVFAHCKSLKNIRVPVGVEMIEKFTFAYCNIERLELPQSVTLIDESAFEGCALGRLNYGGSEQQWNAVTVRGGNEALSSAEKSFGG